jgi:hypothetical protein
VLPGRILKMQVNFFAGLWMGINGLCNLWMCELCLSEKILNLKGGSTYGKSKESAHQETRRQKYV